jgi:hypothetical protein
LCKIAVLKRHRVFETTQQFKGYTGLEQKNKIKLIKQDRQIKSMTGDQCVEFDFSVCTGAFNPYMIRQKPEITSGWISRFAAMYKIVPPP